MEAAAQLEAPRVLPMLSFAAIASRTSMIEYHMDRVATLTRRQRSIMTHAAQRPATALLAHVLVATLVVGALTSGGTAHAADKQSRPVDAGAIDPSGQSAGGGGEAAAIGKPGQPANARKTVRVEMTDTMRFIPDRIDVKRGGTVRFVIVNTGKIDHEFVLGTAASLREHAEHMKRSPQMKHQSAHHVAVAPGKTKELVWQFTRPGTVEFACLVPGHFEAGMRGRVTVQ
jgi:uncharacterized cupredoxin-like copper-binding protein